jgi:hypothetical protein
MAQVCPKPGSGTGVQPKGLLRVTVSVRWIPLVTAAHGTRVARPGRERRCSHMAAMAPQLGTRVRPIVGDYRLVGRPRRRSGSRISPLGYEPFEDHSTGCSPVRNRPTYRGRWLLPHRQPSRPVSSGAGSSREQTVSIPLHHIPTGPGSAARADVADHNPELVLPRDQRAELAEEAHAVPSARSSVPFALNQGSTTSPTNSGTCNLNP